MKIRVNITPELRTLLPKAPVRYDRNTLSVFAYRTKHPPHSWIMMAGRNARYPAFVCIDTPYAFSYTLNKE